MQEFQYFSLRRRGYGVEVLDDGAITREMVTWASLKFSRIRHALGEGQARDSG